MMIRMPVFCHHHLGTEWQSSVIIIWALFVCEPRSHSTQLWVVVYVCVYVLDTAACVILSSMTGL